MKATVITSVIIGLLAGLYGVIMVLTTETDTQTETQVRVVQTETAKAYIPPTAEDILELVNKERAKVGVAPLEVFEPAMKSAQFKADDMIERDYLAHEDPDTGRNNGLDYLDEIDEGRCSAVSENYFWGTESKRTAKNSINEWLSSPPHKEAMLSDTYQFTGIGIAGTEKLVVVQHFCIAA